MFLDIQKIIVFLANYAKEYAILLPDRVCGYKSSYVQLFIIFWYHNKGTHN